MAEVVMYTTAICPYCVRAKNLLKRKGAAFTEINLSEHPELRDDMVHRAGGLMTVPQIFIDGEHIGGSDELAALDRAGMLDAKLAQNLESSK